MLPTIDGRLVSLLAVAMAIAFVLVASLTPVLFVALAIAVLGLVAVAAHRWPLPTLVASAIGTLADPRITPRLVPDGINLGPIGISEPMLAVAGGVVAFDALRRGTFWPALRDPVLPLVALFVALAVLSAVLNAVPPVVALLGIVMTVESIAIYFAARMVPFDERAGGLAIGAVVGAVVAATIFGIAQVVLDPNLLGFFSFEGEFGEGGRITSVLGNPNMVSAVIGLTLPFALFGSLRLADVRWRWVARAALFILVLGLLLTFSRGAWIGVALGTVIGALLLDWRAIALLVLTVVLAWGTATVMPRNLAVPAAPAGGAEAGNGARTPDIVGTTVDRVGSLGDKNDTRTRFVLDGMEIIADHPLLGVGPGRYGGAAATIVPSPVYDEYDTSTFEFRTVHNFWLHLTGESGALGTAVFLAMLLGLVVRFVRGARAARAAEREARDTAPEARGDGTRFTVLAGAATVLLVAGFHSLAEMIFEGNMPVLLLWLGAGIASTMAPTRPLFGGASRSAPVEGGA